MESKFPKRVELERKCLDIVNELTPATPLVGLSLITIRRWVSESRQRHPDADWEAIYTALSLTAEASRSESDISDEIFVDISEKEAANAISELRLALLTIKKAP